MSAAPFDWTKYQSLAQQLLQSSDEESQRSSISRAYYAIMNQCKDRLIQNRHPITPKKRTHQQTWDGFNGSKDLRCKRIASWAVRIKEKREEADYDTTFPGNLAADAALMVGLCAQLAADLAAIPSNLPCYPP